MQSNDAQRPDEPVSIEQVFKQFIEFLPGGVFRYRGDEEGAMDFVSDELIKLMGCKDRSEFDEVTGGRFEGIVHPDDREEVIRSIWDQIAVSDYDYVVYRLNRPDGKELWVDDRGRYVIDSNGEPWFYVTVVDITEKMKSERELERAMERMNIIAALSNDVIFDIDCASGNTMVFGDFDGRFGRDPDQEDFVVHKRCSNKCTLNIHQYDFDELVDAIGQDCLVDYETSTPGPDGKPIWYRYQSVVLYDDDSHPVRHVGRLLDTHEMMVRESHFRNKAEHDSLTGLYNRNAAINRIESVLSHDKPSFTFLLIDVDDFKYINDTYGHPAGDRVLTSLADFLKNTMRSEDIVARLGGDEFAVFANRLTPGPALKRIIDHLLHTPFIDRESDGGRDSNIDRTTITIGVACCIETNITYERLYEVADEALYEAKRDGKCQASIRLVTMDEGQIANEEAVEEDCGI